MAIPKVPVLGLALPLVAGVAHGGPLFVDARSLNFALKPNSPVSRKLRGFRPIPFEQIRLATATNVDGEEAEGEWPTGGDGKPGPGGRG